MDKLKKLPKLKESPTQWSDDIRQRMIIALYHLLRLKGDTRSRSAIATTIHTTSVAINRWENKEGHPTIENIVDFCKAYSFSMEWLMLGEGSMYGDREMIVRLNHLEKRIEALEKKSKQQV